MNAQDREKDISRLEKALLTTRYYHSVSARLNHLKRMRSPLYRIRHYARTWLSQQLHRLADWIY